MSKINKIIEAHKFFVRESRLFVGKPKYDWLKEFEMTTPNIRHDLAKHFRVSFGYKLYYPIAYLKFMYLSIKSLIENK